MEVDRIIHLEINDITVGAINPGDFRSQIRQLISQNYKLEKVSTFKSLMEDCMNSDIDELQVIGVEYLIISKRYKKRPYLDRLLYFVNSKNVDYETRVAAFNGLAKIISSTNKLLIEILKSIGLNAQEDPHIRYKSFETILEVNGFALNQIWAKDCFTPVYDELFDINKFIDCISNDLKSFGVLI